MLFCRPENVETRVRWQQPPIFSQSTAIVHPHHHHKKAMPKFASALAHFPYGARAESGGCCRRTTRRFAHRRPRFVFEWSGDSPRTFLRMFAEKTGVYEIVLRRISRFLSVFSVSQSLRPLCEPSFCNCDRFRRWGMNRTLKEIRFQMTSLSLPPANSCIRAHIASE